MSTTGELIRAVQTATDENLPLGMLADHLRANPDEVTAETLRKLRAQADWVWMPHAAHLIVGNDCRFRLATVVGRGAWSEDRGWIVSTVGEYVPDEPVREIHASVRGITLSGRGDERLRDFLRRCGFVEVGAGRTYETMVFRARAFNPQTDGDFCGCLYRQTDGSELDFRGYNDGGSAFRGHLEMCDKWSAIDPATHSEGQQS